LLIRLRSLGKKPVTYEEERRFVAIPYRQTNRSAYETRHIPEHILERLQMLAGREGTWLQVIEDEYMQRTITDLIMEGDRRQWANVRFRHELEQWVQLQQTSGEPGKSDGLPTSVQAQGGFHKSCSPCVVRTFDAEREEAEGDWPGAAKAPIIAVLGTFVDGPGDWFAAGMAI